MADGGLLFLLAEEDLDRRDAILRERRALRTLRDVENPFTLTDESFIATFRLSKEACRELIDAMTPHMAETASLLAVPKYRRVLAVLHVLGHGGYQQSSGQHYQIGMSQAAVSRAVSEVTSIITNVMSQQYIRFPVNNEEVNEVKLGFMEKFNFPGVIGAIDCTHIRIRAPTVQRPVLYINRKGQYTLNVQMTCNSSMIVTSVWANFPGSVHDSAIWNSSSIKQQLEQEYEAGRMRNSWLIGDSGYGIQPWLMTPVLNPAPNSPEERYTRRLCSARNVIERCFGVMKQRFRILNKDRALNYKPYRAGLVVHAVCVLHNIMILRNVVDNLQDNDLVHDDDDDDHHPGHELDHGVAAAGRNVRNALILNNFAN